MVEHQPSKLRVAGSSPVSRSISRKLSKMDEERLAEFEFDEGVAVMRSRPEL